jgi:hypothetical protein
MIERMVCCSDDSNNLELALETAIIIYDRAEGLFFPMMDCYLELTSSKLQEICI